MKEKDNTQEVAKLRNDIQTLRSNTQSRVNDSRGGPPQSNEGSDGDTMFRLTSDKGLLMFHKFSGVWYSSPFNIGPWTLEDSINALVQDITIANVTVEESTQTSMDISGVFTILNTGTFELNTSATITGLSHSDLDDVGTGGGLNGNVHTQYTGTWSIDASQTLTFSTPQEAANMTVGAVEVVLKNSSLEADGDGLMVNEDGYAFTFDNTLTLQPTASTSLHISSAFADKIKLTDNAKDVIIGSSNAGDLNLAPVDGSKVLIKGNNLSDGIETTGSVTSGSGYVNNSYSGVPLIGDASGIGAKADIVVSGTAVTGFTVITEGQGFIIGEELTVDNADLGGTGSGFSVDVTAIYESWNTGIGSSSYLSGWSGGGWTISRPTSGFSANEWMLEVDNMSVRGTLSVFELLINQIRATNGTLFVASVAKVFAIVDSDTIAFEDPGNHGLTPFAPGDILLCQRVQIGATADAYSDSTTNLVKRVVIEVTAVGSITIDDTAYGTINYTTTSGGPTYVGNISVGDDYVRIGSSSDVARRASILLTADFANAPFIDFIDGVSSWATWKGTAKNKARLGNLTGIVDSEIGTLSGYGLYADNVFLKGEVYAQSGYIGTKDAGWTINSTGISTASAGRKIFMGTGDNASVYGDNDCWFLAESFTSTSNGVQARISLGDCFKVNSDTHEIKLSESTENYIHIKNTEPQLAIYSNGARALTFESTGPKFTLGDPDASNPNYLQYSDTDFTLVSYGKQYFKITSGVTPTVTIGNPVGNGTSWTEITGGSFSIKNRNTAGDTPTTPISMDNEGNVVITGSLSIPQDAGSISAAALAASNAAAAALDANNALADIADDTKVTPSEKVAVLVLYTAASNEWDGIIARAVAQGVSATAFGNDAADLYTYIETTTELFDSMSTTTTIVQYDWRTVWAAYYYTRQLLLNAIVADAEEKADAAASTANNAQNKLGLLPDTAVPSGVGGLYASNTYLGYHTGTGGEWKTFMKNNGDFFLGGAGGALQWDASAGTLTIDGDGTFSGDISAASGTFEGSLSGATITGGTITGAEITSSISTSQYFDGNSQFLSTATGVSASDYQVQQLYDDSYRLKCNPVVVSKAAYFGKGTESSTITKNLDIWSYNNKTPASGDNAAARNRTVKANASTTIFAGSGVPFATITHMGMDGYVSTSRNRWRVYLYVGNAVDIIHFGTHQSRDECKIGISETLSSTYYTNLINVNDGEYYLSNEATITLPSGFVVRGTASASQTTGAYGDNNFTCTLKLYLEGQSTLYNANPTKMIKVYTYENDSESVATQEIMFPEGFFKCYNMGE